MKTLLIHLVLFLASIPNLFAESLILAPGMSQTVSIPSGVHIRISNGGLVRARDMGHSLILTGRKNGTTELRIGQRLITLRVVSIEKYRTWVSLNNFTKDKMGLRVDLEDDQVLIMGELLRWEDWKELSRLAQQNGFDYGFNVQIRNELENEIQKRLLIELKKAGLPEASFYFNGPARAVFASSLESRKMALQKILKPFGFNIEFQKNLLTMEPMINVQIVLAELQRQTSTKFGVHWPDSFKAQILPTYTPEAVSAMVSALEDNGKAKVLASPRLSCKSGEDASFLAGGELPIKIMNFKTQDVVWKKYGVLLKIKPTADEAGRMSIGIETEVSMIDSAHAVDGVPGFLTNRIQSHFVLEKPQTITLSGLLKQEWGRSQSGLPLLQNIPILGPLFSSRDYRENKTELVVFVSARTRSKFTTETLEYPKEFHDEF